MTTPTELSPRPVAVIGAGVAGLTAARTLSELGREVVVFDKGRGPGGRVSSRRAEPFAFDHGAQYFTARDPRFQETVNAWLESGDVRRWDGGIVALAEDGESSVREGTERFVGVPHMNQVAKALAEGLDVRTTTRIASLSRDDSGWHLTSTEDERFGPFSQLLVTAPPDQAADLIADHSKAGSQLREIPMAPCWAVLLGFETRVEVDFDGAFCDSPELAWICRNSSKPGRPAAESWVLHATSEWSLDRIGHDRSEIIHDLTAAVERITGRAWPRAVHEDAHFWRYSRPAVTLDHKVLVDEGCSLAIAGDAYTGGRVEGAYVSGLSAAQWLARAGAPR